MTRRQQLTFLNIAHFACHYFLLIFPTVVIAIERAWALEYGAALTLGTPLYLCFALATLPAGWLGDRWDGERMIALFFIGCGLASLLIAVAPGDIAVMAGLGLLGIFAAIYHPVGLSMVTAITDRPGHALAVNGVYGNLGLAASALLTGLLADSFGWRAAFLLPGLAGLVIGAAYLLTLRRTSPLGRSVGLERVETPLQVAYSTQVRVVGVVLMAALFSGLVFNGVSISLPKVLEERLVGAAGGLSGIGGYSALVFAVAAFAQLPVGALLDRVGGKVVMLGLFALEVVALILMSQATGYLIVPAALVTVTLLFASIPITGWLLGRYVARSWRSRAFAAEYVLSLGMSAMIVPIMAWLHRIGHGFDWQYLLFAASAGVVVAGALAIPAMTRAPRSAGAGAGW